MLHKLVILLLFVSCNCVLSAECNWSTIQKVDGGWLYTQECHLAVGKSLKELDLRVKEVELLEQRIELWKTSSYALQDRVLTFEKWKETHQTLYFLMGVGFMGAAVWSAGQLK